MTNIYVTMLRGAVLWTAASMVPGMMVAPVQAQDNLPQAAVLTDRTEAVQGPDSSTAAQAGFMTDLALVAAARGWTLQQAVAHRAISDRFGRIQEQLAMDRPGLYAGAELSAVPDGAPTLYIKGAADEFVRRWVDSAGFSIRVIEGRPFSWRELEERSIWLNRWLVGLGFRDIVTSFDESTSNVEAIVTRGPALAAVRAEQVLASAAGGVPQRCQVGARRRRRHGRRARLRRHVGER